MSLLQPRWPQEAPPALAHPDPSRPLRLGPAVHSSTQLPPPSLCSRAIRRVSCPIPHLFHSHFLPSLPSPRTARRYPTDSDLFCLLSVSRQKVSPPGREFVRLVHCCVPSAQDTRAPTKPQWTLAERMSARAPPTARTPAGTGCVGPTRPGLLFRELVVQRGAGQRQTDKG